MKTALRGATEKGSSRAAAELLIVNGALETLHQISTKETKAVVGLDREIELFKDTMNLRLDYYRQLQQISDTVAPYEENMSEEARNVMLLHKKASESRIKARIATLKSKGRYLVHLRDEATNVESQRLCIICQQPFEMGILTSCGHSYCVECLRLWWGSHRNCPTCKKHLTRNDFHQITYIFPSLVVRTYRQVADQSVDTSLNNLPCRKKGKRKKRRSVRRTARKILQYTQKFVTTSLIKLKTSTSTARLEQRSIPSLGTYCGFEITTLVLSPLSFLSIETFWMFWQEPLLNFESILQASTERTGYRSFRMILASVEYLGDTGGQRLIFLNRRSASSSLQRQTLPASTWSMLHMSSFASR